MPQTTKTRADQAREAIEDAVSKGWSHEALSAILGVSSENLRKIERGEAVDPLVLHIVASHVE